MPASRLLLVDDDRLALATTAAGLRAAGYAVDVADSGEAALALAAQARFDLAVLDIRMPGLSGIELCHLLERRHQLPSLFLSAYGDRDLVAEAIREGGLGYVLKPADTEHLMPAVEAALARARDLAALRTATAQLEQALNAGRKTSVAVGIVMARRGLPEQAAFEALREEARGRRCKLEAHAADLVRALEQQPRS